jgi:virginiamycin B lyase
MEALESRRLFASATEVSLQGLVSGFPYGLTSAADGSLWFGEVATTTTVVGRFDPVAHTVQEVAVPQAGEGIQQLFRGPDGNIWFLTINSRLVGEVTLAGAVTKYNLAASNIYPSSITTGPDGNIWVADPLADAIDRILSDGTVQTFPVPPVSTGGGGTMTITPDRVTAGADGNVWFDSGSSGYIGQVTPGGVFNEFAIGNTSPVTAITLGPDGNVWFSSFNGSFVGQVTPAGAVSLYTVNNGQGHPITLGPGPGGTVAFGDGPGVGLVSADGTINETVLSNLTGGNVSTLALDGSGNLWFNEQAIPSGPARVLGEFHPSDANAIHIVSVPGVSQNGVLQGGAVAVFASGAGTNPASAYGAAIFYGDGSSTYAPVVLNTATHAYVVVSSAHTYSQSGTYVVTVVAWSPSLGLAPAMTSFAVTANVPTPPAIQITLSPNAATAVIHGGLVATFTTATFSAPPSAFTAAIDYGDGALALATVVQNPMTHIYSIVVPRHIYASPGTYKVTVGVLSVPLDLPVTRTTFLVTV